VPSRPDTTAPAPRTSGPARLLRSPWLLAVGFAVVHAWAVAAAIGWSSTIYGDVTLYEWWARHGLTTGEWPVLSYDWVYPVGALVPVVLPALVTSDLLGYEVVWTAMIVLLDAAATVVLVRATRHGVLAAWWWLAFLLALGPIFLGRLDGVIAPLILVALVVAGRRPALAAAVATAGAWIKIAPGAVVVALAATRRHTRDLWRTVVVPGAAVSVVVVGLALAGGAGTRALSVFGQQDARRLQVESVAATGFSVARLWDPRVTVEYNDEIFTYEVLGDAAQRVASALDWLLPLTVLALAALVWWAARRRPDHGADVLLLGTAALLLALIVFNKVGSPQFVAWLGPPMAAAIALATPGHRHLWVPPAIGVLLTAFATYLVYPVAYGEFLAAVPWIVVVEALRNLALTVLLAGAVWRIAQLGRGGDRAAAGAAPGSPGSA
jgi:hypothetical protein